MDESRRGTLAWYFSSAAPTADTARRARSPRASAGAAGHVARAARQTSQERPPYSRKWATLSRYSNVPGTDRPGIELSVKMSAT